MAVLAHVPLHAQEELVQESFKQEFNTAVVNLKNFPNDDTNRVNALFKIMALPTFKKEREMTEPYRQEALSISRKLNFRFGIASGYHAAANYYKTRAEYSKSLLYYDSASQLIGGSRETRMRELKAIGFERKGIIYTIQENYYAALDNFFESLKYWEEVNAQVTMRINVAISDIYITLKNVEKAREYIQRNLELMKNNDAGPYRVITYLTQIDVSLLAANYMEAAEYLDMLAPTLPGERQSIINFGYYMKRGRVSAGLGDFNDANRYFHEAYKYAIQSGHKKNKAEILQCLSTTAIKLGDYESARKYSLEHLLLADESNGKSQKVEALTNLAEYYKMAGDKATALTLLQQAMLLKDSVMAESNLRQVNILGAVYETEKQNRDIARLQTERDKQTAETKHRSFWNKFFVGSIVILLIIGYLGFINFKKGQQIAKDKETIQRQKINELEKDKQLLVVDAMLKGQEEERSRIAKDLHDGLGSLLSGTKLSLMNVRENMALPADQEKAFDKSLGMLDHTIRDLRKIAQNLMPEALAKFGLYDTLVDFCDSIQVSTGIKIVYQQFGDQRRMDNTAEVFIYRMIQELVNNAVKHAEASEIIVQLVVGEKKVELTVEDNGKGFDPDMLGETSGQGMLNIRHRMAYFNGKMDLATSPGKGTSINIELKA